MVNRSTQLRLVLLALLTGLLGLSACVDGPSSPVGSTTGSSFALAPVFSLAGPAGTSGTTKSEADALGAAFDQVNRFRMVVVSPRTSAVVLDTTIAVTPAQSGYSLSADIDATPGETFTVTLTALDGSTVLFTSDAITVTATPPSGGATGTATPTTITLHYSGPGATATSVSVAPSHLVLAPGGEGSVSATVEDRNGDVVSDVPVVWSSGSTGVATVSATGSVGAAGRGVTQITVTTPTGLQASAWAYVVGGTLAYVTGGVIETRAPAGGTATAMGGTSASELAWSRDGKQLYYVEGGSVRLAGDGAPLVPGTWPSLSPDGTKLAVDTGSVLFSNADGSNPTSGPGGRMPVWADGADLLVAGSGIQRVRADGAARTTLVAGDATWPALSSNGRVAYVANDSLKVVGQAGALLTGALGRPSWSANGLWLVVRTASGLTVVPADGAAPAVALRGLADASSPAFRPAGTLESPPALTLTGIVPANAVPGSVVTIAGSGFDWIIPANDTVVWPTENGTTNGDIDSVAPTAIQVVMPLSVVAGQVRVRTRSGTALLAYQPTLGSFDVTAHTANGHAVSGVVVAALDTAGAEVAHGRTNASGGLLLPGLTPADYTLHITAPNGFTLSGDSVRTVTLGASTLSVDVVLSAQVASLQTIPDSLQVEVQGFRTVKLVPLDVRGDTITSVLSTRWTAGSPLLAVTGSGLTGTLTGVAPGTGPNQGSLSVTVGDSTFRFPVDVTSFIRGTVTQDSSSTTASGPSSSTSPPPASGITVKVLQGSSVVGSAVSDAQGRYAVHGLFAGTYSVTAVPTAGLSPVPDTQTVVLDTSHPVGQADIVMSRARVDSISLSAVPDTLVALGASGKVRFVAFDSTGARLVGRTATFASSAPAVATVNPSGNVKAVGDGVAWIRVTVGSVVDSVEITVAQKAVSLVVQRDSTFQGDTVRAFVGDTGTVVWSAKDANGYPVTYKLPTFLSSDTAVGIIDSVGVGHVVGAGVDTVTVRMDTASDSFILDAFGVWHGNVTAADIPAFYSGRYGKIVNGNLMVDSSALTSLNGLQYLQKVDTGSVEIIGNASLTDISALGALEYVSGDVIIQDDPLLTTPSVSTAAALTGVGGSMLVVHDVSLTNADIFGNVQWIGGDLEVADDSSLTNLDGLGSLAFVNGSLLLVDNPSLSSLNNLPRLQALGGDTAGGNLLVDGGATTLGLPSLQNVLGAIAITPTSAVDSTLLTDVELPRLQCVGGGMSIYGNLALKTVATPALATIAPCGGPVPVSISVRAAARRARGFADGGPPAGLRARAWARAFIEHTRQAQAGRAATARHAVALERQAMARRLQSLRRETARRGPGAGALDGPRLAAPPIQTTFRTAGVSTPSALLDVTDNPELGTLDLASLTYVDGDLDIGTDGPLGDLSLPALGIVEGTIDIVDASGLTSFTASALHDVNTGIHLANDSTLSTFSAADLHQVAHKVDVESNPALASFYVPALQAVGGSIALQGDGMFFYGNPSLTDVSLPALQNVGGPLQFVSSSYSPAGTGRHGFATAAGAAPAGLETFSAPVLSNVASNLTFLGYPNLGTIDVATGSGVSLSAGSINIEYDLSLTSVRLPGLVQVGGNFYFASNDISGPVILGSGSPLTLAGSLVLNYNNSGVVTAPSWSLSAPGLTQAAGLDIGYDDGLDSLAITGQGSASVGTVYLLWSPDLRTFALPTATLATGVVIDTDSSLDSLSFPELTRIGGSLMVSHTALPDLNAFSKVTSALSSLTVTNDLSLTDVSGLDQVGNAASPPVITNGLTITGNTALKEADVLALWTLLEGKGTGGTGGVAGTVLDSPNGS